jgi:hypothetical protein
MIMPVALVRKKQLPGHGPINLHQFTNVRKTLIDSKSSHFPFLPASVGLYNKAQHHAPLPREGNVEMDELIPRSPWIGNRFDETKLLIIGESHYWDERDDDDPTITTWVVERVTEGERPRFFTQVETAMKGCGYADVNPAQFWPTVSFANFCQGVTEKGKTPDKKMWDDGARVLHKVLDDVKPERMLFFSKQAWNHTKDMTGLRWEDGPFMFNGEQIDAGYFISERTGLRVYSSFIRHPGSRGWGEGRRWTPRIRQFLETPRREAPLQ